MVATLAFLYRYPVKGLTAERLIRADLTPGKGVPHDRRFAIAHGSTRFDPAAPEWLPKTNFLQLMRNERLAQLNARFEPATGLLILERDGKTVVRANTGDAAGRMVIEQFFAAFMGAECRGTPRLLEADDHMFSDIAPKVVSLIGLASVRDLERVARGTIDPRRFRANLYFEQGRPWEEFGWVGRAITLGGARLRVIKRIGRCAATEVNPETAKRDMNIPRALQQGFGHTDMGVYAEVVAGGTVKVGDTIGAA
jgi:uncharacterized protein